MSYPNVWVLKLEWAMIYFIFLATLASVTCYLAFHYRWYHAWENSVRMQGISRVFNNVRGRCVLGYKLLLRASFDSKTTIPFVFFYHSSPIWQLIAKWKVLHPIGVSSSHQWYLPTAQYVLSNTTSILKFLYANLYQDEKEWILISNFRIV